MTTRATPAKAAAEIRAELEGLRKDLPTLEDRCHQADAALQAAAAEVIKARELLAGQHHTINELEAQAAQLEAQP